MLEGANGFCDTKQRRKCDKIAWQKIGERKGLADFFVAASLKFGKVEQNFVKVKHTGSTRLQHSLTVFFAK